MSDTYHPDPTINAEIAADALAAETFDLSIGYPPRLWTCPCGATHGRGHFLSVGVHRCLTCGYYGTDGVMHGSAPCGDRRDG
jgi:hypothetical protein